MNRRELLRFLGGMVQAIAGLAAVVPMVRFLLHSPSRRRRDEFIRVAPLTALSSSAPTRVAVRAARIDGFLRFPDAAVGHVWLDRMDGPDGTGEPQVRCLHTVCPHLGCGIDYSPSGGGFVCRCHHSDFSRDGTRLSGPSPRGMDELECRVTTADAEGRRWVEVRYREFPIGRATT